MAKITDIHGREVLDSRGTPTVEVDVWTGKTFGRAIVPSGASTGAHEAVELRDNDNERYNGKGVKKAVYHVNTVLRDGLLGMDVTKQADIDEKLLLLDGSPNKSTLGANAVLGVSLACARAASVHKRVSLFHYLNPNATLLPVPLMNVINGGKHADSGLDIQEFMIVPVGAQNFADALRMGVAVFQELKKLLHAQKFSTAVGDEGGFAPALPNNEAALDVLVEAVAGAGLETGRDIVLALDCAASELYDKEKGYTLNGRTMDSAQLIDFYTGLVEKYPIISIEDGLSEDDWEGWQKLTQRLGSAIQIVGDDLLVTNVKRIKEAIEKGVANSVLIKPNQIGTLTETLEAVKLAHDNHYTTIMSHRSGETEDSTIADLAVAFNCGQIKTGSLSRTDRIAKYNQLLRIEEELGDKAKYPGRAAFRV